MRMRFTHFQVYIVTAVIVFTAGSVVVAGIAIKNRVNLARNKPLSPSSTTLRELQACMVNEKVIAAMASVDRDYPNILAEWKQITEIPAPSGSEQNRAMWVARELDRHPLTVSVDSVGNVVATRKGSRGRPRIVIDAHLDTVFKEGTKIHVTEQNGRLYAPGIGDNSRNIEALLAVVRALDNAKVLTRGDLVFLFSTGEESDNRGVEFFLQQSRTIIDSALVLDAGFSHITYAGLGLVEKRYEFNGPGGHMYESPPPYSAIRAAARAISRIDGFRPGIWQKLRQLYSRKSDSSYVNQNIGMFGGGERPSLKAKDAWFTIDMRSNDPMALGYFEEAADNIVREEAQASGIVVQSNRLAYLPAANPVGSRSMDLLSKAESVHSYYGLGGDTPTPTATNNLNFFLNRGIPGISTGVAKCYDAHSEVESCEFDQISLGIKKTLLLILMSAQVEQ